MSSNQNEDEINNRLRLLAVERFGQRGRFRLLEDASGIAADKWRNFHYKKQRATKEMVLFWCVRFPEDEIWLRTGISPPNQNEFPFNAPVPVKRPDETAADRLSWVISEWASPKGESLFEYLEQKSNHAISAADWAQVILRKAQPTVEMVRVVCECRPMFTEWVVMGQVGRKGGQVDPSDEKSVREWNAHQKKLWSSIALNNDDQTS